jgi:hypothetical protein
MGTRLAPQSCAAGAPLRVALEARRTSSVRPACLGRSPLPMVRLIVTTAGLAFTRRCPAPRPALIAKPARGPARGIRPARCALPGRIRVLPKLPVASSAPQARSASLVPRAALHALQASGVPPARPFARFARRAPSVLRRPAPAQRACAGGIPGKGQRRARCAQQASTLVVHLGRALQLTAGQWSTSGRPSVSTRRRVST